MLAYTAIASGTIGNVTFSAIPVKQMTILELSNFLFPRNIVVTGDGIMIVRGNSAFAFTKAALIAAAVAQVPALTWPPVITTQPVSQTVTHPAATMFSVVASSETGVSTTYQWQISTNQGGTWTNITNTGVYSNATTATLSISNTTNLNGAFYQCICTNASGSSTSNAGVLTVN